MKVLINISVISKVHRGMGVFAKQIIKELIVNDSYEFIFVSGNDLDKEIFQTISSSRHSYKQITTPLPIFEQVVIPYFIRKYKPDVCWFPSNTFPVLMSSNIKYIATIHDLIFLNNKIQPESIYQKIGKLYRMLNVKFGIKRLSEITSVSSSTLQEIYKKFNIQNKRIENKVLYNSYLVVINEKKSIFIKLNLQLTEKYLYTIADTAPHKNLDFMIEAFERFHQHNLEYKLVISGASKSKHSGQNSNVIFTPFISEEEKTSLIKNAQLFVFPSLVEGFGIPLIEGLYHNQNVLVSDIPIFREIGKEYVSYFDPYDKDFLINYFKGEKKSINHEEAKQYILETFDAKKSAQKLEDIFNEFR